MEIREESLGWKRRNLAQVATFIGLAYVTDVESPVVGISEQVKMRLSLVFQHCGISEDFLKFRFVKNTQESRNRSDKSSSETKHEIAVQTAK